MKKIICLLAVAAFIACKKEQPVQPAPEPVYKLLKVDSATNFCFYQTTQAVAMFIVPAIICIPCSDSVTIKTKN